MYGKNLRIGLMVPCVNSVMRPELSLMAPEGVEVYETRMLMRGANKLEQLSFMLNSLNDNVEALCDVADVFAYGCTSGSFTKGYAFDKDLIERISTQSGRKAVSAASSIVSALQSLNAKRIVLATPYIDSVNQLQISFFKDVGIEVVAYKGLNLSKRGESGTHSSQSAYNLVHEIYQQNTFADAIVISCTNFRSVDILQQLESELQIPVISSNQAVMWAALRAGGIDTPIRGYGKLLEI